MTECMFIACLNVQSTSQQRTVTSESVVSKEHPNTVQPKARLSLFDDEDDDNDVDLFTVNSTSTTSTTTKAATVDTSVVVSYSCSLHAVKYRRSSLLLCVILNLSVFVLPVLLSYCRLTRSSKETDLEQVSTLLSPHHDPVLSKCNTVTVIQIVFRKCVSVLLFTLTYTGLTTIFWVTGTASDLL